MLDYYIAHAPPWRETARFFINGLAIMGCAYLLNHYLLGGMLSACCIPRTLPGLAGIAIAPLLHGDIEHLFLNAVSLVFLGWLIMFHGLPAFLGVTALIWLVDGIGVWLFGQSNAATIGASGIVYGYIAFLMSFGIHAGDWFSLMLGTLAVVCHTAALGNLTHLQPGISLISHWAGFVGGMVAARLFWVFDAAGTTL